MPQTLIAGVFLLEELPGARNGAAGAHPDDEVIDLAVGLLPDLGPGLIVVRRRVRQVVVLIRLPRIGDFLLEARRHGVVRTGIFRVDVGRTDDDLGAECLERVDLFLRLLVGRREDALVALDDRGDGEPHAGVAGRAFDDRAAGLEQTGAFGVLDHPHGHAVFDRIAGVERFELGDDRRADHAARQRIDTHHRGLADGIEDGAADLLHGGDAPCAAAGPLKIASQS